jgi:Ca2+-binding RTX toxin-like protein
MSSTASRTSAALVTTTANNANFFLNGNDGDDILLGFGGDDILYGDGRSLGGNDVLNGGADHDTLNGGPGGDTMAESSKTTSSW